MKRKIIAVGIIVLFIITAFAGTTSAKPEIEKTEETLISPIPIPKIKGIIVRAYVIGDATSGKQIERIALIDFTCVGFKVFRLLPPGIGYIDYLDVSVLIIGLKSKIPEGSFHLDTQENNNKVFAIVFK